MVITLGCAREERKGLLKDFSLRIGRVKETRETEGRIKKTYRFNRVYGKSKSAVLGRQIKLKFSVFLSVH